MFLFFACEKRYAATNYCLQKLMLAQINNQSRQCKIVNTDQQIIEEHR